MKKLLQSLKNLCDEHCVELPVNLGLIDKADKIDKAIENLNKPTQTKKPKDEEEDWFE